MIELAVIIAVGSAYHQSVLTYNRPAAMLPVVGKPMVARMMEQLHDCGINHYVVIVGRDEGGVAAYLNKSWLPDVRVNFALKAPDTDLGRVLLKVMRDYPTPFILASYNSFAHHQFARTMIQHYGESPHDSLLLGTSAQSLSMHDQPYYATMHDGYIEGISQDHAEDVDAARLLDYAICGSTFEQFLQALVNSNHRTHHLMDIFSHYRQAQGLVRGVETDWILPVRCDADLLMLNQQILQRDHHNHILSEIPANAQIIPPVRIDPKVSVGPGAIIGPSVYLETGSQVGTSAQVQHALVMQNGSIHANESVSNMLVTSRTRIQV